MRKRERERERETHTHTHTHSERAREQETERETKFDVSTVNLSRAHACARTHLPPSQKRVAKLIMPTQKILKNKRKKKTINAAHHGCTGTVRMSPPGYGCC